jgi:hypothetical protein
MLRTFAGVVGLTLLLLAPADAQQAGPGPSPAYDPFADFTISEDFSALPAPVRETREKLIAAARSGDIEALRPIIEAQGYEPRVSFGDVDDAVDHLKEQSGDPEGRTILAILADTLDAPYGVLGASSDQPIYIWPYLAGLSDFTSLTPSQQVDALRIVTWSNFEDLQMLGAWYYWRALISKDGGWQAFVAGD